MKIVEGMKFGRLTVVGSKKKVGGRLVWFCKCVCGKGLNIRDDSLKSGHSKSCGCLSRDVAATRCKTHGLSEIPEYDAWENMRFRCNKTVHLHYKNYGGRGIKVCDRWQNSFMNFYKDVGPRPSSKHSLDRINNNGNYEPGNVRWTTQVVQVRNSRKFILVEFNGKKQSLADWAEETGLPRNTIYMRLYNNWSTEEALTTPQFAPRPSKVKA